MSKRIDKNQFVKQLANRMNSDEFTAVQWLDAVTETLCDNFERGYGVTLTGFGGFYVRPEPSTWVFKFNPGQRIRAFLGWSSTYKRKE